MIMDMVMDMVMDMGTGADKYKDMDKYLDTDKLKQNILKRIKAN